MKKRCLCILIIATITLTGCQSSPKEFLTYENSTKGQSQSLDNGVTEADFFAEDIAVISETVTKTEDEVLNSGATLLINVTDHEAVYADHIYDKVYPSSLTKLLTALVVFRNGELKDSVTISDNAFRIAEVGAKVCGYEEGDIISMEALLNSLLIYSGNDAAIAIAEHMGGSEEAFVAMMNKEAASIGAVHSNFMNSTGLHDDNQYTTAYDMYLIFNELLTYDTFRNIIGLDSYTAKYKDEDGNDLEKIINSSNSFADITDEQESGMKVTGGLSGSTNKAGNCCILLSKDSNNIEYISVILKAESSNLLYSQISHLFTYAGIQ